MIKEEIEKGKLIMSSGNLIEGLSHEIAGLNLLGYEMEIHLGRLLYKELCRQTTAMSGIVIEEGNIQTLFGHKVFFAGASEFGIKFVLKREAV